VDEETREKLSATIAFNGVQGLQGEEGELFGVENLLQLSRTSILSDLRRTFHEHQQQRRQQEEQAAAEAEAARARAVDPLDDALQVPAVSGSAIIILSSSSTSSSSSS
jgi:hypothetical protein